MNFSTFTTFQFVVFLIMSVLLLFAATFVIVFATGLAKMTLVNIPSISAKAKKYFGTPDKQKFELNWFFRQFFLIFNKNMSERWYETRAHVYQSVLVSMLSTFGIATVVRYEFFSKTDHNRVYTKTKIWYFTLSFKTQRERMKFIESYAEELRPSLNADADSLYQIFIAGENVVWDYMNGGLGKYRKPDDFFPVM